MVVGEDDGGSVAAERGLDDLARVDAGLREGAAERLFELDHAVLRIEPDADEHFMRRGCRSPGAGNRAPRRAR
jgi:hypothetical protein